MIKLVPPDVDVEDADPAVFVIAQVAMPLMRRRRDKTKRRPTYVEVEKPSVDLQPSIRAVRALLVEAKRMFRLEARRLRSRTYKRVYEDNFKDYGAGALAHKREQKRLGANHPAFSYDYRGLMDDDSERWADKEWVKLYDQLYKRERGNPGGNRYRSDGPPLFYLPPIVRRIANWWEATVGETFKPNFGPRPYNLKYCNAEARLLFLVMQECGDPRYSLTNAAGLTRNVLRPRTKKNKT
ncbi:hypothetical protein ACVIGA_003458 [Bradyrhizobium sp. USDA 3240]